MIKISMTSESCKRKHGSLVQIEYKFPRRVFKYQVNIKVGYLYNLVEK